MKDKFRESERNNLLVIFTSIIIYIFSLATECVCTAKQGCGLGIGYLIAGTFGVFTGGAAFSWLANPCYIIATFLSFSRKKYSIVFSTLALLFGLIFLSFDSVLINEAGHYDRIISYELGYWLWLTSFLILGISNLIFKKPIEINEDQL